MRALAIEGVCPRADQRTDAAESARGRALLDAVETIADMAQRIRRNGPQTTYTGEKLETVVYKAAEGLALCEVSLDEVVEQAGQGHRHGMCLGEEGRCDCPE